MPTFSSAILPPPKSWIEFEDITLDALKKRWNNPSLQKNWRQWQKQDGVDIYWVDEKHCLIWVQCKHTLYEINISLIEDEIIKAERFIPIIHHLYIATTKSLDSTLQEKVRVISKNREEKGLFWIDVFFWDDIVNDITSSKELMMKHYPQFFSWNINNIYLWLVEACFYWFSLKNDTEILLWEAWQMSWDDPMQLAIIIHKISILKILFSNNPTIDSVIKILDEYSDYFFRKESWKDIWVLLKIANRLELTLDSLVIYLEWKQAIYFQLGKILWKLSEIDHLRRPERITEWELTSIITKIMWLLDRLNEDHSQKIKSIISEYASIKEYDYYKDYPYQIYQKIREIALQEDL